MVRSRKRKTEIGTVAEEDMKNAVAAVLKDGQPLRETARTFQIPRSTLQRYVTKCKEKNITFDEDNIEVGQSSGFFKPNYSVRQIFSKDEELLLVAYLQKAADLHHGLPAKEARKLAYQYAVKLDKKIPDAWNENQSAGEDWLASFMKRGAKVSFRKPQATSLARSMAFNKPIVHRFYDQLNSVYLKFKFGPESVYNLDETGMTNVQVPGKVIASKGVKQVGQTTSAERGDLVTMCGVINALGNAIPPFFIFPRVNFKETMLIGAPLGSAGAANLSGWMTNEIFLLVLKHFIKFARPTSENPALIIMDNHESHVSLEAIQLCKGNNVVLLTIPPHTSHRLQPLDKGVYGPMKRYYNDACSAWLVNHPGQRLSIHHIAYLVRQAYPLAFSRTNILSGFKATGIYPFNKNIYKDEDFVASEVTDVPKVTKTDAPPESVPGPSTSQHLGGEKFPHLDQDIGLTPGKPEAINVGTEKTLKPTPESVRPHPKALPNEKKSIGRAKKCSEVLTDTPVKERIEKEFAERVEKKNQRKTKKEMATKTKDTDTIEVLKIKKVKKKLKLEISSGEEEEDEWEESSSDSDFQMEELSTEEDMIVDKGDFILIKVCGKKNVNYYTAEVINKMSDDEFEVRYFKRVLPSFKFVVGEEKTYIALGQDIEIKLPKPTTHGGTERTAHQISFNVDLSSYSSKLQ